MEKEDTLFLYLLYLCLILYGLTTLLCFHNIWDYFRKRNFGFGTRRWPVQGESLAMLLVSILGHLMWFVIYMFVTSSFYVFGKTGYLYWNTFSLSYFLLKLRFVIHWAEICSPARYYKKWFYIFFFFCFLVYGIAAAVWILLPSSETAESFFRIGIMSFFNVLKVGIGTATLVYGRKLMHRITTASAAMRQTIYSERREYHKRVWIVTLVFAITLLLRGGPFRVASFLLADAGNEEGAMIIFFFDMITCEIVPSVFLLILFYQSRHMTPVSNDKDIDRVIFSPLVVQEEMEQQAVNIE